MKLSELKEKLNNLDQIEFQLPNGELVPSHFHVTEVGQISKRFIDCGGKLRNEEKISLQLWNEQDYDHRLHPEKLVHIVNLSEEKLGLEDAEIEVEFQGETIQKFGLSFDGKTFQLTTTQTDCLARENCGIPNKAFEKPRVKLSELNSCAPNSGCC
ncbi:DUF6428 family protein [Gramella sp. AN32]|uniref:DUF6428 family protein n=1 Tax=Christiangramia antarctica TaxID=2058158 RepID=A0ABW5X8U4_9FLAO|nr:DUF6428 family protein [Gramella sp. AN32]MCM4155515.1 hypothetical protein [Gramella sp. AN32]